MAQRAKTRVEEAFNRLRADILGGRLQPGQKLPFADLCATYGVSVGAIREALSALVEQGLVQTAPQQGFFVTPITRDDLIDLTIARREIETLTLRHAIQEGSVAWEAEILAAEHRLAMASLFDADDEERLSEEWVVAHREFHETVLMGCKSPRLRGIATQLRLSAELYRRWSIPLGHSEDRDIVGEHHGIVMAVLARDVARATDLLDAHISLTTDLLLQSGFVEEFNSERAAAS